MNSRERLIKTINHQETDQIVTDLGSTLVTGISASALAKLRKHLGLKDEWVKVHEPFQLLGYVEEDLRRRLSIDVVGVSGPVTMFGYKNEGWKQWKMPDGTNVLVGKEFNTTIDEKGNTLIYPQGDTSVEPSGKLPKEGFYFDGLVRQKEIIPEKLNGKKDYGDDFKIMNDDDLRYIEEQINHYYYHTDYGINLGNFVAGLGDFAPLTGPGLKETRGIRDVEEWLIAHYLYPNYIHEIFDYQTEIALKNLQLLKEATGKKAQIIQISGTDFGTQQCEIMSPDTFREFYKPYYTKLNKWVHENTEWKTFYHCCGSVVKLLDDFVDMGIDILNPVQCSAKGMEAQFLKDNYGDKFVFWGGGVDTQHTLPFGTPDEVSKEVTNRLEIFSKGGGFVFNPIHNIQGPTPVENIVAMFDAVQAFNKK